VSALAGIILTPATPWRSCSATTRQLPRLSVPGAAEPDEKYLERKVWTYWLYETAWGHLNLTNFDPAAKDNIMLTGWFGLHVGMYMLASGDRRYAEPGSLTFRLNARTAYRHDIHTLASSVRSNFEEAPFCLYPCEPNWVYPICNHYGLASLAVNDRLFGAGDVPEIRDRWLASLDAEFTDESGSIVGLRSSLTGCASPSRRRADVRPFMDAFAPSAPGAPGRSPATSCATSWARPTAASG